jgi:hypothetical protein
MQWLPLRGLRDKRAALRLVPAVLAALAAVVADARSGGLGTWALAAWLARQAVALWSALVLPVAYAGDGLVVIGSVALPVVVTLALMWKQVRALCGWAAGRLCACASAWCECGEARRNDRGRVEWSHSMARRCRLCRLMGLHWHPEPPVVCGAFVSGCPVHCMGGRLSRARTRAPHTAFSYMPPFLCLTALLCAAHGPAVP